MTKLKYLAMTLGTIIALGAGCSSTTDTTVNTNANDVVVENTEDVVADDAAGTVETGTVDVTNDTPAVDTTVEPTDVVENTNVEDAAEPVTQTFDLTASQFEFSPSTITVSQGDTVVLNITSDDVPHGFSLPEFGVNETLTPGKTKTVQFVADQVGTFNFSCSVSCGSGHSVMTGKLIVE